MNRVPQILPRLIKVPTLGLVPRRSKLSTCAHRQRRFSAGLGLLWVLLFGFQLAGETSPSVSDYSFDVWQTEQGLPQDSVTAIVQSRDGYLWLARTTGWCDLMACGSKYLTPATRRNWGTVGSQVCLKARMGRFGLAMKPAASRNCGPANSVRSIRETTGRGGGFRPWVPMLMGSSGCSAARERSSLCKMQNWSPQTLARWKTYRRSPKTRTGNCGWYEAVCWGR